MDNICGLIVAACILHNMCILNDDIDETLENDNIVPVAFLQHGALLPNLRNLGNAKRLQIMKNLP